MKLNSIIFFVLFCFILSCSQGNKVKQNFSDLKDSVSINISERMFRLFIGIDDKYDSLNPVELTLNYLNKSMYKQALVSINKFYPLDTVYSGGFSGFKLANDITLPAPQLLIFRLNDYTENLSNDQIQVQLLKSVDMDKTIIFKYQDIEDGYLELCKHFTMGNALEQIEKMEIFLKEFPRSKRIEFLLANTYLKINKVDSALQIFDYLIDKDYYALKSLRAINTYLSKNPCSLSTKYSNLFKLKFPTQCNITQIDMKFSQISQDSIDIDCKICNTSDFQIDSVMSKLYFSKLYLTRKDFAKLNIMLSDYFSHYQYPGIDSLREFENGLYNDLEIRSLFLQKQFGDICRFVTGKNMHRNRYLYIETREQLKQYLQNIFIEYYPADKQNFDSFFAKEFNCQFN